MTVAEHLVACTRDGDRSLLLPERAGWLWKRLREGLPQAFSCVVMPDHLHWTGPPGGRPRFRRILAAFTVRFGVRFDVLEPEVANSEAIAGRMIRDGFFNPPRAGLIEDPWSWPWSTLRDLVGAALPIWTPLSRVASVLGQPPSATLRALTRLGEARPEIPTHVKLAVTSLDAVRSAVRSFLRLPRTDAVNKQLPRKLIVQACFEIGAPSPSALAKELGCSVRSIHRDRAQRHPALDGVLLCLGDARLIVGPGDLQLDARCRLARTG